MAIQPALIALQTAGNVPANVTLPDGTDIDLRCASATFDGTSASGTFLPCLTVVAASGQVIGRFFPSQPMVTGDSGEVTYGPFLDEGGGGLGGAELAIKVYGDSQTVAAGTGVFIFDVAEDMAGMALARIEIYVTTVSSAGLVQVQVANNTTSVNMLSTVASIDANEKNSKTAATPPVINPSNATVAWADELSINVTGAGTGAKGLGVLLKFE